MLVTSDFCNALLEGLVPNELFGFNDIMFKLGSCHKRQKPQAPTPQAPNEKSRKRQRS